MPHSEFNDITSEEVNFLQFWIIPETKNVIHFYTQKIFKEAGRKNKFQTFVSQKNQQVESSLLINHQCYISMFASTSTTGQ